MDFQITSLTFRPFTADDEAAVNAFFDAMGGETRALFNRRDYNRNGLLKFCRREDPTRRYMMAEADGEMVGYFFFLDFDTGVPELGIAVRDGLRGRGLGGRLMERAIALAREAGKGGIQLSTHVANIRAQALYEKHGFVCRGTTKNGTELYYLWRERAAK